MYDLTEITNHEARRFADSFFTNRAINKEFYRRVPEDKFDYRMVDTPQRKSDSPRESLIHQIDVTRNYCNAVKSGILSFETIFEDLSEKNNLTKNILLQKLEEGEKELLAILSDADINNKKITVPWDTAPVAALSVLWSLDSHETLHTGWNLAIMDHLNIERFPALKAMWG